MLHSKESFATDVDKKYLKAFVDHVQDSIEALRFQYEHLQDSKSLIHSAKITHVPSTFRIFGKIVSDYYDAATFEL